MKFDKKFEGALRGFDYKTDRGRVRLQSKPVKCSGCKSKSRWTDVMFGKYVCSEKCQNKLWDAFEKDLGEPL